MIENDPRQVIHEVVALEAYLDDDLEGAGLTYEEWVEAFSRGSYHARNLLIVELAAALQPPNVLELACAGPHLARGWSSSRRRSSRTGRVALPRWSTRT